MDQDQEPVVTVLDDGTEIIRTNIWSAPGCHPVGCGVKIHVKDGEFVKIEGDESHPISKGRLCPRCLALKDVVYHKDRVLYPMYRDPKDRGFDRWKRVSWDEALDILEENYNKVLEKYGHRSMVVDAGTGREACIYQYVIANQVLQTPNVVWGFSGSSCYIPREAASYFVTGGHYMEMDIAGYSPLRYDDPEYVLPEYMVMWGKNPLMSNADGLWGHAIIEMARRGSKLITVDPKITWIGAHAEYNLQLRPGTDGALALGLINVIINEDLYDHEFVDLWCYGFEELKQRVQEYPPDKVAEITWVPEEQIRKVARALGTAKPWTLCYGVSVDQAANSIQINQALAILVCITGMYDAPGGTIPGGQNDTTTLQKDMATMGSDTDAMEDSSHVDTTVYSLDSLDEDWMSRSEMIGAKEYPLYSTFSDNTQADCFAKAVMVEEPYPIRFLWSVGANTLTCASAETRKYYEGLKKLDFCVIQDCFMTPTAMALGDLFLPVSMSPEHDGIVYTHYGANIHTVGAMKKCFQVGETKSDVEICNWAGHRLNPKLWTKEGEDFIDSYFNGLLQGVNVPVTYKEIQEEVHWQPGNNYYRYKNGKMRQDGQVGFDTRTGRVELYSLLLDQFGEDPLPYYEEPPMSPISQPETFGEYPLVLTSGARELVFFHSEHRQVDKLRECCPWPKAYIHPNDAKKYGIHDGEWIWIENPYGRAKEVAVVTETMLEGTVSAQHGWWYPEQEGEAPNLFGVFKSGINCLMPYGQNGKTGYGANYRSLLCKIRPAAVNEVDGE